MQSGAENTEVVETPAPTLEGSLMASVCLDTLALILNHSVIDENKTVRTVCKAFNSAYQLALSYHQDREIEYLLKNQASILAKADIKNRAQLEVYFSNLNKLVGGNKKDIAHIQNREIYLDKINGVIIISKMEQALLNPSYYQLACASCYLTRVPSHIFQIPRFRDFWQSIRSIDLSNNHLTRLPLMLETILQSTAILRLEGNRLAYCPRAHDLMESQNLYVSQVMDFEDGCESPDNRRKYQKIF